MKGVFDRGAASARQEPPPAREHVTIRADEVNGTWRRVIHWKKSAGVIPCCRRRMTKGALARQSHQAKRHPVCLQRPFERLERFGHAALLSEAERGEPCRHQLREMRSPGAALLEQRRR